MHQRRRLEGVVRAFLFHLDLREPPKLVVDQGEQLIVGVLTSLGQTDQDSGDLVGIGHEARFIVHEGEGLMERRAAL